MLFFEYIIYILSFCVCFTFFFINGILLINLKPLWKHVRGSTLIGQSPIKSLSSFCLSVHLSVRPSLNFLKIGSSAFSDIVHDDSWPWYPVTDRAKFLKKKKLAARILANGTKWGPKLRLFYFLKFGLLVFLEVAYSLQQCLTSTRDTSREKKSGGTNFGQTDQNWVQN